MTTSDVYITGIYDPTDTATVQRADLERLVVRLAEILEDGDPTEEINVIFLDGGDWAAVQRLTTALGWAALMGSPA